MTLSKQTRRERIVRFERGYDCIKFECINDDPHCHPGSGGSHGRCGLKIRFVVKGEEGAVQFLLMTGWVPQYAEADRIHYRHVPEWESHGVIPSDLGYHSKKPQHEGQIDSGPCEFCDGEPCYYDGSGLNASDAMYALVNGGDEALWEFLEAYYATTFEGAPYPVPAEFKTGPRDAE